MNDMTFLEDFAKPRAKEGEFGAPPVATSNGYDDGYTAGWNDAIEEERKASDKLTRDMALALQEAGFTYFEARQHILKSLRPVLEAISEVILPELARSSLGPTIAETIEYLAESIEQPIEILCPPHAEETLKKICEDQIKFPVTVTTEATLADQQVLFRYADGSAEIDMSKCVADIQAAISEFYDSLNESEVNYA